MIRTREFSPGMISGPEDCNCKVPIAELADAQEVTSDPEILAKNKQLSAQMQEAAGVRTLIKKVRGK